MSKYSIESFVKETAEKERGEGKFELENPRCLEVKLDGKVWTKWGSMVAYIGSIKFKKAGLSDKGLGKVFKEKFTGEGMTLTKAEGQGMLYLADQGKRIAILELNNESIFINGNDVLAFEDSIAWDIKMIKSAGMVAGGLFNVKLSGTGMVAFTTHGAPLTLMVPPDGPLFTDPNATVGWSDGLYPGIHTDMSLGTFLGKTSGETIQLKFTGNGFVIIQPFEEVTVVATG